MLWLLFVDCKDLVETTEIALRAFTWASRQPRAGVETEIAIRLCSSINLKKYTNFTRVRHGVCCGSDRHQDTSQDDFR